MRYELRVIQGHRYAVVSIRLADGGKVWVNKEAVTTLDAAELAEGEDKTIERYEAEGRFQVVRVVPEAARRPGPKPTKRRRAKKQPGRVDLEE